MSHIGLVCPPYTGHLTTMTALGRELARRGLRTSLVSLPDAESRARQAGLSFAPVGAERYPAGFTARFVEEQGRLAGLAAIRSIVHNLRDNADALLTDLPDIVGRLGIDGLVVDQVSVAANSVADRCGIPFVTVCSAIALNTEPDVPPWGTAWKYRPSPVGRWRNAVGNRMMAYGIRPMVDLVNQRRAQWGMPRQLEINEAISPLAQITQQPEFFDFPRTRLPDWFHYAGPMPDGTPRPVAFPWERLDGRPLIYASMGTLQNRLPGIFRVIARACAGLDAQLVISLGREGADAPADLPGDPVVVGYAPQLDLLARASLVISHGGPNTILESLAHGVPVVAVPVTNDQPGSAARLRYLGAGEFVPVRKVSPRRLRSAVQKVRADPAYRARARQCRDRLAGLDGPKRAADIVEEAFRTGEPVLRSSLATA